MPAKPYALLEHTADLRVRITAQDLAGLFINAAKALFDILAEKKPGRRFSPKMLTIKKSADSVEELMIAWLSELLSLSDARGLIFTNFRLKKISEIQIEAKVSGLPRDGFRAKTEIKAATYHELKVEKKGLGWLAEVVFDV
ncbi:MAG: archease [Candidatus Omnitrophota bacterium]